MGRLGTDLVSVACIRGGAAAACGLTYLALDRAEAEEVRVDVACPVEVVAPSMVVALGEGRVHVSSVPMVASVADCAGQEVRIHMDEVRLEMDRARAEVERARREVERERDRIRVLRLEEIDGIHLELMAEELAQQAALLQLKELDLEGELARELQAVEEELARELQAVERRISGVARGGGR